MEAPRLVAETEPRLLLPAVPGEVGQGEGATRSLNPVTVEAAPASGDGGVLRSGDHVAAERGHVPQGRTDCHGQGTHVARTAGGSTFGVARAVRLHSVRVLDCNGFGLTSQVIAGVNWVTAHLVKPAVANISLGGGTQRSLDQAFANSIAAGISHVIAAGNSNLDACTVSPARATDTATKALKGTSMAASHLTGAAALYQSSLSKTFTLPAAADGPGFFRRRTSPAFPT